jgi:DNA-binding response OmpR family regulator
MRILVIEDEIDLAEALVDMLASRHHVVDHAPSGLRAEELVASNPYDLILLDRNIPPSSGDELLREWRDAGLTTPVLMITGSKTSVRDRVEGLEAGADDCLTKPFAFRELRARIRSLLRRPGERWIRAGDLAMDTAARTVAIDGRPLRLTPKEFAVAEYLLMQAGSVVPRAELAPRIWADADDRCANAVDVFVYRLRKKIDGGRDGKLLRTVPGVGYLLATERR